MSNITRWTMTVHTAKGMEIEVVNLPHKELVLLEKRIREIEKVESVFYKGVPA